VECNSRNTVACLLQLWDQLENRESEDDNDRGQCYDLRSCIRVKDNFYIE